MSIKAFTAMPTKVYPHPNADRLELAEVLGYQVIVGKGTVTTNTSGVLFLPDAVLTDKAIEVFGEQPYLQKNRVKALTLRGAKSEALFLPRESAAVGLGSFTNGGELPEGFLWKSYKLPRKEVIQRAKAKKVQERRELPNFPMHRDTQQYRIFKRMVEDAMDSDGKQVSLSLKYHGTSQRSGRVLVDNKLSWWKRLLNKVCPMFPESFYAYLNGTRRVIISKDGESIATREQYREDVASYLESFIKEDEVWFYEIVGFGDNGTTIMPGNYLYGCSDVCNLSHKVILYRVTVNNKDLLPCEIEHLLSTRKCLVETPAELKLVVPEDIQAWYDLLDSGEDEFTKHYGHTMEGLCIRIDTDGEDQCKILKYKTHKFLEEEGRH